MPKKKLKVIKKKNLNCLASRVKNSEPPLHALLNYKAEKDHG
jgi:hypothetical protein